MQNAQIVNGSQLFKSIRAESTLQQLNLHVSDHFLAASSLLNLPFPCQNAIFRSFHFLENLPASLKGLTISVNVSPRNISIRVLFLIAIFQKLDEFPRISEILAQNTTLEHVSVHILNCSFIPEKWFDLLFNLCNMLSRNYTIKSLETGDKFVPRCGLVYKDSVSDALAKLLAENYTITYWDWLIFLVIVNFL